MSKSRRVWAKAASESIGARSITQRPCGSTVAGTVLVNSQRWAKPLASANCCGNAVLEV